MKKIALPDKSDWPNPARTREELNTKLKAGYESGISPNKIPDLVARIEPELKSRD